MAAGIASVIGIGISITQPAFAAGAPGSLDPTFGTAGQVTTNLGTAATPSDATLQSNGDIVVSGNFGIIRYLPNGTLDTSFGTNGVASTGFTGDTFVGSGLAIEPNGDLLWAGSTNLPNNTSAFAVARFALLRRPRPDIRHRRHGHQPVPQHHGRIGGYRPGAARRQHPRRRQRHRARQRAQQPGHRTWRARPVHPERQAGRHLRHRRDHHVRLEQLECRQHHRDGRRHRREHDRAAGRCRVQLGRGACHLVHTRAHRHQLAWRRGPVPA